MNNNPAIYVVEDDAMQCELLADHLAKMSNYPVRKFDTGEECLKHLAGSNERPVIFYLDYYLNSVVRDAMDGPDVLAEIKKSYADSEVIMLSSQDKIEVAVDTMKYGAFDYIVKGESAFYRAEKALYNIYRLHKLKKNTALYKTLSITFGIAFLVMIILFFILYKTGVITDLPGWM
jgi:Response regulator containing CheY-like receiver, AAA-type ATPase, and DNA-binding domains